MVRFAGLFFRENLLLFFGTGARLKIDASGLFTVVGVCGSSWQEGCELNWSGAELKLNIVVMGLCICI